MFSEIRFLGSVAFLGIASYTDLKTREVSEKLSIPMIILGAVLTVIEYWSVPDLMIKYLGIGISIFLVCLFLYFYGALGGGDILMFVGIAFMIPNGGGLYPPFFSILFIGLLSSLLFFGIYHLILLTRDRKKIKFERNELILFGLSSVFGISVIIVGWKIALVLVPLIIGTISMSFKKTILERYYLKWIPVGKIDEEEVLAVDYLSEKQKAQLGIGMKRIFDKKIKEKAKKYKIKKLPVFLRLPPFIPFLTLGAVAHFLGLDVFLYVIQAIVGI